WAIGYLSSAARWAIGYLSSAARWAAVHLSSAPLHFGHGLRPMKKAKGKFVYVRAQHKFSFGFFRTAHC
ncbi:hypothetical protein DW841_22885, partial [Hungatella hathewayi]